MLEASKGRWLSKGLTGTFLVLNWESAEMAYVWNIAGGAQDPFYQW